MEYKIYRYLNPSKEEIDMITNLAVYCIIFSHEQVTFLPEAAISKYNRVNFSEKQEKPLNSQCYYEDVDFIDFMLNLKKYV